MPLDVFAGDFAINTSTGNQAITDPGFTPSIVLFFPTNQTVDGVVVHAHASFGAAISSTERFAITANSEDGQGSSDAHREASTTLCILLNQPGVATAEYEADFVSLDANGFTINVTNAPGSAFRVGYLAIGGTDLTDEAIGNFALNTATGNQAVTGVGFTPDVVIFGSIARTPVGATANMHFYLGFAISSSERAAVGVETDHNEGTSNTQRVQRTDICLISLTNAGAANMTADFVSMDADGFTINITDAPTSADIVFYIALQGGQYSIGDFVSQTGTGNFSETGTGFTPNAGFFSSFLNAANAGIVAGNEISLGVATETTERFAAGCSDEDGQATTDADSYSDDASLYLNYDFNQTLEGNIDFVSWDADGLTMDQVDADPSANQVIYMVMGNEPAAGGLVGIPKRHPMIDYARRL